MTSEAGSAPYVFVPSTTIIVQRLSASVMTSSQFSPAVILDGPALHTKEFTPWSARARCSSAASGDASATRKLMNTGQNSCSRTQQMRLTQPSTNSSNLLPAGVLRNFDRTLYAMKEPRAPPTEPTTGPTYSCHFTDGDEEEGGDETGTGVGEGLMPDGGGGGEGSTMMELPFCVILTCVELPAGTVWEPSLVVMPDRNRLRPAKRAERAFWKTAPGLDSRRFTKSAQAVPESRAHDRAGRSGFGTKMTVVATIVLPGRTESTDTERLLAFPTLAWIAWT